MDLFYYSETDSSKSEVNDLSWKQIGQKILSPTSNRKEPIYCSTLRVRIPYTGIYILKPRTIKSRVANITDININGKIYNKVPVYYNHIDCVMPADMVKYATYTVCDNPNTDDPMLFVEGNAGNRIVGFNDNISEKDRRLYNEPSEKDALVNLSYRIDTSGLHVISNNSFAAPYVAGVASLILSINPEFTYEDIRTIIAITAKKLPNYEFNIKKKYGTWNKYCGYGLVDAESAVKLALKIKNINK